MKYLNKPTKNDFSRNYSDFPAYAGKNGKTKRLSVKDNRLKSRKPKAETPPQIIKYRDDSTRQQFRERHGEPDAGDPGHTGSSRKAGTKRTKPRSKANVVAALTRSRL